MQHGRFITFEGGEGAGKSTQIARLRARLEERGVAVLTTREPGGTPLGERIRQLLVTGEPGGMAPPTELLLMAAARAEHLERVIRPALARGSWVLCDRFADSTTAYQGYGRQLPLGAVAELNHWVLQGFRPHRTLLLDLDPVLGIARSHGRDHAETRFEREAAAFHQRVREGFLAIARAEPGRVRVVDAAAPLEAVAAAIWEGVAPLLAGDAP